MKILVTGGLGFIGLHLIKKLLKNTNNIVLNLDSKTYCSMPEALNIDDKNINYNFEKTDITNANKVNKILTEFQPNLLFHLAAESHVDNSITNPGNFIKTNVVGTYNLLNGALINIKDKSKFKFIHISTDEVYGSLNNIKENSFIEESKFLPNSPYAASKSSSDLLVRAWNKTYKLRTITTNCVNNFGPWQFPEKLIPVVIYSCLKNINIPVYGKGNNIREWIHVNDHVKLLIDISKKGKIGECYNIGSGNEFQNIDIIKKICTYLDHKIPSNKSYLKLIKFVKDRPGHDFRYSINSTKLNILLKRKIKFNFDKKFNDTIDWYINNKEWLFNKKNKYFK